jgi:pyruvate,water dikinase
MYSLPALTYRLNRGIRDSDAAMCVGAMVMLDPVSGGVCYSRSPFKVRDDAVYISSAWGLPKLVVDGVGTPDRFVVARQGPDGTMAVRERRVAEKRTLYVCRPEAGVVAQEQEHELISKPSLTDAQAVELARLAALLEEHYGSPQDIEWALEREGGFSILQCRPLSVAAPPRHDDAPAPRRDPSAHGTPLVGGAVTAAPGVGCGPVHVVERDPDALTFPQGGVLVARFALPKWASLLNWASAVVTEQGSVTGHLANVAREFGVPMITGAAGAVTAVEAARWPRWTPTSARSTPAASRPCCAMRPRARTSWRAARCTRCFRRSAGSSCP